MSGLTACSRVYRPPSSEPRLMRLHAALDPDLSGTRFGNRHLLDLDPVEPFGLDDALHG